MVLAGGASRRLDGAPKGLELVGGIRIIDRVVSALRATCDELLLAANSVEAAKWLPDVAIVRDGQLGHGGLAGLHASLELGRDVVVVAWDMPFVTAELIGALANTGLRGGADVVVPESDSPHGVEPFCAFYSQRVLDPLTAFLASGGTAAHVFVESLGGVHRMPPADVRGFGDPGRLFFSVNTRGDLERARAMAEVTE